MTDADIQAKVQAQMRREQQAKLPRARGHARIPTTHPPKNPSRWWKHPTLQPPRRPAGAGIANQQIKPAKQQPKFVP